MNSTCAHPSRTWVVVLLCGAGLVLSGCDDTLGGHGGVDAASDEDASVQDPDAAAPDGAIDDQDAGASVISGVAEKGPFVLGSSVTISAVDNDGDPTGLVFNTQTTSDLGRFELAVRSPGPVELAATGYYYNEATGALSAAPLTLRGWYRVLPAGDQTANLNVITHLINRRVRALFAGGLSLQAAIAQAEGELVGALGFGVPPTSVEGTSRDIENSAYLLAVSAVLAEAGRVRGGGNDGADAALQELLNVIAADLEDDGAIESALRDELVAAQAFDVQALMDRLAARYEELGNPITVPDLNEQLDADLDGLLNRDDNCPNVANPDQLDSNSDSVGDACCGDGTMQGDEACDDGANNADDAACTTTCTSAFCGDTLIWAGHESCDDGNAIAGDGCENDCSVTPCGDGALAENEGCDDGNMVDGDGCDSNCTPTGCGNLVTDDTEECDDGNAASGDGCDSNCRVTGCGNGIVTSGEACDNGPDVPGDDCGPQCEVIGCGNGSIDGEEVCDDGNLESGDGCDANCRPTGCGNGMVSAGEACDDGNVIDHDYCDATCQPSTAIIMLAQPSATSGNPVDIEVTALAIGDAPGLSAQNVGAVEASIGAQTLALVYQAPYFRGTFVVANDVPSGELELTIKIVARNGTARERSFTFAYDSTQVVVPELIALEPPRLVAGSPAQNLVLRGKHFVPGYRVWSSGSGQIETFQTTPTSTGLWMSEEQLSQAGDFFLTMDNPEGTFVSNRLRYYVVPVGCGNGMPDVGEQCDDGNEADHDGCDLNCTVSACNSALDPGEPCLLIELAGSRAPTLRNGSHLAVLVSAVVDGQATSTHVESVSVEAGGLEQSLVYDSARDHWGGWLALGNMEAGPQELVVTVLDDEANTVERAFAYTFDDTVESVPEIVSITPNAVEAGSASFTIALEGARSAFEKGFVPGSVAYFDATALDTRVTSLTTAEATVPGVLVAAEGQHLITIKNPGASGTVSNEVDFSVTSQVPPRGAWSSTGSMAQGRYDTICVTSTSGKVVVAGGTGSQTTGRSTEIYDPVSGLWTVGGALNMARSYGGHRAIPLGNGQVLLVGGVMTSDAQSEWAETIVPETGAWTLTHAVSDPPRRNAAMSRLDDGSVLLIGGYMRAPDSPLFDEHVSSAELYDPDARTWTTVDSMSQGRAEHSSTTLADGRVLVAGGTDLLGYGTFNRTATYLASAEVYDPVANEWTSTGAPSAARAGHTALALPNGKVLMLGGRGSGALTPELYDPATGTWSQASTGSYAGAVSAVLLQSGLVLAVGTSGAALYDPESEFWYPAASLPAPRDRFILTVLPSGKVLLATGTAVGSFTVDPTALLFDPTVP